MCKLGFIPCLRQLLLPLSFEYSFLLVELVENLGGYRVAYGTADAVRVLAKLSGSFPVTDGAEYDFAVRPEDVRYFDPKDGKRLER